MAQPSPTSKCLPPPPASLRIRVADVPALFSEGVELEPQDPAQAWWHRVEAGRLRVKLAWPGFWQRRGERSKALPATLGKSGP
jgi:hypothetical protein